MATYELTDELVGLLEKAMKSKPKDVKQRTDLNKKSKEKVKELRESIKKSQESFKHLLDESKDALLAALGVATSEVGLRDREVVRHLKQATKCNDAITRPKGWQDGFDKAFEIIAEWDPKTENADDLEKAIKLLKTAKKTIETWYAAYQKEQLACNASVNEVFEDLKSMHDEDAKGLIQPYLDKYRQVLAKN